MKQATRLSYGDKRQQSAVISGCVRFDTIVQVCTWKAVGDLFIECIQRKKSSKGMSYKEEDEMEEIDLKNLKTRNDILLRKKENCQHNLHDLLPPFPS